MKNLLFGILSLISSGLVAQVTIDKTSHDFGDIHKRDPRLAEFNLMNKSSKSIFILRADQDHELDIKFSTKTVASGTYATIRIQYNPRSKGRFKKDINLYISSSMEPIVLELQGTVKELETSFLPCPSFTHPEKNQGINFSMNAIVTDKATGLPIPNAGIQMIKNGVPLKRPLFTDDRGMASKEIPLGLYYVVIEKEGYQTKEGSIYLNRSKNTVKTKLLRLETPDEPVIRTPIAIVKEPREEPEEVIVVKVPPEKAPRVREEVVEVAPKKIPVEEPAFEEDENDFSAKRYAANNIVFLIDVSLSMKREGRLDLLKASMLQLLTILRDIDQVSILTYTTTSKMVLESINATEKNKKRIAGVIQSLEALGGTQGGQAIRAAYVVAQEHFIKGGNNQIILATDGLFGDNYEDVLRTVKRNARNGRIISVVGIKNGKKSALQMKDIATKGLGHYINISSFSDAQENLIKEIKASSLRGGL